ncbi:MAG: type II toxin-antitoxin system RelE/ParE family toxin [Clostridia bacterium]|nr:type II toxin-antitoxin system RelE/ParE family toxin [Clostridia bacterium]
MSKQIVLSNKFQNSLKAIIRNSKYLPENFYERILLKLQNLKVFPNMYPISKKTKYRKISFQGYIILYYIKKHQIRIADIVLVKMKKANQYLY